MNSLLTIPILINLFALSSCRNFCEGNMLICLQCDVSTENCWFMPPEVIAML